VIGRTLRQYQVVERLGAGGMGEVYRAHDTKLRRDVALKVLPAGALADEEARRRFRREAETLSRLSHPHVAALLDADTAEGVDFLVMELVPGETLDDELRKGPLAEKDVVRLGTQLARGLMAAHDAGVVHRDLKPSNLGLTADGLLKVLDFGVARLEREARDSKEEQTSTETGPGAVVGSPPYLAPEQLLGKEVDARTDLYTMGVVLYELVTGKRPYGMKSGVELQDAILHEAPRPPREVSGSVSPGLQAVIVKAMDKDPRLRYETARELLVDLERLQAGPTDAAPFARATGSVGRPPWWRRPWVSSGEGKPGHPLAPVAVTFGALAAVASLAIWLMRPANLNAPRRPPVSFAFDVEQEGVTGAVNAGPIGAFDEQIALCPDGTRLAYRGALDGIGRLFLRPLDRLASTPLPGTERPHGPFFSPDGLWLAFFADGRLKKLLVDKPLVKDVAPAPSGGSGTFGPDGRIYFTSEALGPLSRVSVEGGAVEVVTQIDVATGESHRWPVVLPDGQTLIYEARDASRQGRVVGQSLADGRRRTLVEHAFHPRWAGGHLLFFDGVAVKAAPLDPRSLRLTGPALDVVEGGPGEPGPTSRYDASDDTLAWLVTNRQPEPERALFEVGRSGRALRLTDLRRAFRYPRFSPDGRRLAVTVTEEGGSGIWILDIARRALARLTPSDGSEAAIWTPDGKSLTYRSKRGGAWNLFSEPSDGSGPVKRLTASVLDQFPASWSPDGRALAFIEDDPVTGSDIRVLSRGDGTTRPLVTSPHGEWDGMLSPDGRLVAYASTESGRLEVYLRPYPGPGSKQQVSAEGGNSPVWSRSGKELFYLNGRKMMVASISSGQGATELAPALLFEGEYDFAGNVANYDVTPDGKGFVMIRGEKSRMPWVRGRVVMNWLEDLKPRSTSSP